MASDSELKGWLTKASQELASRREFNRKNTQQRWKLADHYDKWPRQGVGAPAHASPAGEFSVLPDGATAISGIYPNGVYSHLLSSKHGAVITSPRFKIHSDSISLRFLGGNFSYAQLIIENYAVPRGGIFNSRTSAKRDEMGLDPLGHRILERLHRLYRVRHPQRNHPRGRRRSG